MYDHILVRYGELNTKGQNKGKFIGQLFNNIKYALNDYDLLTFEKTRDRIYIYLNGQDSKEIVAIVSKVFGIQNFSLAIKIPTDLDQIVEKCFEVSQSENYQTFKVSCKRNDKNFPLKSDKINRLVATKILSNSDLKVDVKNPDLQLNIEIRSDYTYIFLNKIEGSKGYPVGVGAKAMVMMSGGIDSPVAAYMMMKRGVKIECVHFASPPYTSDESLMKVIDLVKELTPYCGNIKLHVIPFTKLQTVVYQNVPESYAITIMRRMMYRIGEQLSERNNCFALVNGESLGQVASQTIPSINVIGGVCNIPILRPVICLDKLEIIDIAQAINTYDISIRPFEDCCTIFTPKSPTTNPKLEKCLKYEKKFEFNDLIERCLDEVETYMINPTFSLIKDEIEDLF